MRRSLPLGMGLLLIFVLAGAVSAAKPTRGCGNEGFVIMSYPEFRQLSLDVGVPEELLGPEHETFWNALDRNDDGLACIKDLPDTSGHLGSWVFNAVDNTANH